MNHRRCREKKSDVSFSLAREKMKHRNLSVESLGPAKINIGESTRSMQICPKENNATEPHIAQKSVRRSLARGSGIDKETSTSVSSVSRGEFLQGNN